MDDVEKVLAELKARAKTDRLKGMARYGMTIERRLSTSAPDMRNTAKELGKNHRLALRLWKAGIAEAMIVAAMIDEPDMLTEKQIDDWVKDFDSWDICDQVCMNLFEKTPLAWKKILDWSEREEEFVKRAAYVLLACLVWHDKKAEDKMFIKLFPIIKQGATDERNYVKKAVNWALRNIGKRNTNLNRDAIAIAKEIKLIESKAANWIASDTVKELESESVQRRLKKKRLPILYYGN